MENKDSTRYYSDKHEKSVIKALGGRQTSNSGANRFEKGDVIIDKAYMLCECKCSMSLNLSIKYCIKFSSII